MERQFFPLDVRLKLRTDRWSEGVARVATLMGLQSKSFYLASNLFEEAVGSAISPDSLRRVTQKWGKQCEKRNEEEMKIVHDLDSETTFVVEEEEKINEQATLSTDGGMMLVRSEGWKEVKLVAISSVRDKRESECTSYPDGRRYAPWEPQKALEDHSYLAILGNADEIEPYQYLEGVRRGLRQCRKVSAVHDAAVWIERITKTNFPDVPQIVDWFHAVERLWQIAKVCLKDKTKRDEWVSQRQDELWQGKVESVIEALSQLTIPASAHEDVGHTPGYFERHKERMRYHRYRVAGYPIGSGSVESGINKVVHHRLKRQGRGWNRRNAQAMLAGLCALHSGRFHRVWMATR